MFSGRIADYNLVPRVLSYSSFGHERPQVWNEVVLIGSPMVSMLFRAMCHALFRVIYHSDEGSFPHLSLLFILSTCVY